MIAKSEDLRRSLSEINHLLEALRTAGANHDVEIDAIDLLERSRRSIVNMLESRREQNQQPIVSLQAWRDGNLAKPLFNAERLLGMAPTNRPASGVPRPHRVS